MPEKLERREADKKVAFLPETELLFEETAASKLDAFVVNSIAKVRGRMKAAGAVQAHQIKGQFETKKATGEINGLKLEYDALVSSPYNEVSAGVMIADETKQVSLHTFEELSSFVRFTSITVNEKDHDGRYVPVKRVELQQGANQDADARMWSWVTVEDYHDGVQPQRTDAVYDASMDVEVRATIDEARALIAGL